MRSAFALFFLSALTNAACPYMDSSADLKQRSDHPEPYIHKQDFEADADFLKQFVIDDTNSFITSDAGEPIQDSTSLKAGERGPTLLEDFIFWQKIQHFDHERVS